MKVGNVIRAKYEWTGNNPSGKGKKQVGIIIGHSKMTRDRWVVFFEDGTVGEDCTADLEIIG